MGKAAWRLCRANIGEVFTAHVTRPITTPVTTTNTLRCTQLRPGALREIGRPLRERTESTIPYDSYCDTMSAS